MIYTYFEPTFENIEERNKDLFKIDNALYYGNLYMDEYKAYKTYRPSIPSVNNDKDELMRRIQIYTAASQDLKLSLDVDPTKETLFKLFKEYSKKVDSLVHEYEIKYYPIFAGNSQMVKGYFNWVVSPSVFLK